MVTIFVLIFRKSILQEKNPVISRAFACDDSVQPYGT